MGRSVADVAELLNVMAGADPADAATHDANNHKRDYVGALNGASLKGTRLGVLRFATDGLPAEAALFERAVATLRSHGAKIIDLRDFKLDAGMGSAEIVVLMTEFKADLNAYLKSTPPAVKARSLAAVIAFNRSHQRELSLFGQELFDRAEATTGLSDPRYLKAREKSRRLAADKGIDKLITINKLDALIAPSYGPAWRTDVVTGDHDSGSVSSLPAIAGYPHLTVPMGYIAGLPVGISFIGRAWTEERLLAIGAAYEAASHVRRPPDYAPTVEGSSGVRGLLDPE